MPDYRLTITFQDELDGQTTRTYEGTFADDATAATKANDLMADFNTTSKSGLEDAWLAKNVTPVSIVGAGSRVFEVAKISCRLNNSKMYTLKLPAPEDAIMSGNSVLLASAGVVALLANFATGEWTVSDGNFITAPIKGERAFVASGKTNLPS